MTRTRIAPPDIERAKVTDSVDAVDDILAAALEVNYDKQKKQIKRAALIKASPKTPVTAAATAKGDDGDECNMEHGGGSGSIVTTSSSTVSLPIQPINDDQDNLENDIMLMTSAYSERTSVAGGMMDDTLGHDRINAKHRALSRLFDLSSLSRLQPDQSSSLMFRSSAPSRSQDRDVVDLTHFERLRVNEMPLAKANGVSALIVRDAHIDSNQFKDLSEKYLQQQMLPRLLKLDLTNNNIGKAGATILCRALQHTCRLVHLSLAGNKLGDSVVRKVLEAIKAGDGCDSLLKLDLRENTLTFTSGMIESLSHMRSVKVLDLSYNAINLESKKILKPFIDMLGNLSNLQVFSLAYTRLHDQGALALLPTITDTSHPELTLLDLSHCFFTKRSLNVMKEFLCTSTVQMLILTGMIGGTEVVTLGVAPAVSPLTSLEQLTQTCQELGKRVSFADHHAGIEILENYLPFNKALCDVDNDE